MTSKGDIFDQISPEGGDIFDKISTAEEKRPLIGKKGTFIGGKLGSAIETASEHPSQVVKEVPVAAAQLVESPIRAAESALGGVQKLLGSNIPLPTLKNSASEHLAEYVRQNLSPEEQAGAQDIADIEEFLLPLLKFRGSRGAPKAPGEPKAAAPKSSVQQMYEQRAALAPQEPSALAQGAKDIGKSIKEKVLGPNISEEIPKSISPQRFKNSTSAGMDLEKAVAAPYKELSVAENKAYDVSRAANKAIEEIHPELASELDSALVELEKIPDPSAPMKRFIESSKKLSRDLVERSPDGSVVGYKPISNQTLINQIQEYNQIPKYDFPTDTKTGIFKSLINKITAAVDRTAAKHPHANQAWQRAKTLHAEKSALFDDPDVSKWIKLSDKNYSKDFLSSIDIDKIRKLEPVLKTTKEGKVVLQEMKRELVERTLEDNFTVGKRFDQKQISRKLAELEPVLTEEEMKVLEQLFQEAQTPGAKVASLGSKFLKFSTNPTALLKEAGNIK